MVEQKAEETLKMKSSLGRYPSNFTDNAADHANAAVRLYGLRFYCDQTPVEYLAEFLLVFASPKGINGHQAGEFEFKLSDPQNGAMYWPKDRVALKLFAFFPSSKLDTRHPVHQKEYLQALEEIKSNIKGSDEDKSEAIRLLQSLLSGFVGIAKNRTWATHSFLPASQSLLARELDWNHSAAVKDGNAKEWRDIKKHFATDKHSFMARGGELLFLQLTNLFDQNEKNLPAIFQEDCYAHLNKDEIEEIRLTIEQELRGILENSTPSLDALVLFVDETLSSYELYPEGKRSLLGWTPKSTISEALIFACEIKNICCSALTPLEKIDLLQTLCCMHVLRTLCFQASRNDDDFKLTEYFAGNYVWVAANPNSKSKSALRKLAQTSFSRIEELLYRVLRKEEELIQGTKSTNEADKHGFKIFRRIAKEIGIVVPRTGTGQHFVLTSALLRFLVAAVLRPGERIPLTKFYARVFAHYGIALGDQQLAVALRWSGHDSGNRDYAVAADTSWVEETLQQGGFLVALSDAVSIVHNPDGQIS